MYNVGEGNSTKHFDTLNAIKEHSDEAWFVTNVGGLRLVMVGVITGVSSLFPAADGISTDTDVSGAFAVLTNLHSAG